MCEPETHWQGFARRNQRPTWGAKIQGYFSRFCTKRWNHQWCCWRGCRPLNAFNMGVWWNWQTRRTQNPMMVTSCGFKSHYPHQKRQLWYLCWITKDDVSLSSGSKHERAKLSALPNMPSWRNRQTCYIQSVVLRDVRVQVPPWVPAETRWEETSR